MSANLVDLVVTIFDLVRLLIVTKEVHFLISIGLLVKVVLGAVSKGKPNRRNSSQKRNDHYFNLVKSYPNHLLNDYGDIVGKLSSRDAKNEMEDFVKSVMLCLPPKHELRGKNLAPQHATGRTKNGSKGYSNSNANPDVHTLMRALPLDINDAQTPEIATRIPIVAMATSKNIETPNSKFSSPSSKTPNNHLYSPTKSSVDQYRLPSSSPLKKVGSFDMDLKRSQENNKSTIKCDYSASSSKAQKMGFSYEKMTPPRGAFRHLSPNSMDLMDKKVRTTSSAPSTVSPVSKPQDSYSGLYAAKLKELEQNQKYGGKLSPKESTTKTFSSTSSCSPSPLVKQRSSSSSSSPLAKQEESPSLVSRRLFENKNSKPSPPRYTPKTQADIVTRAGGIKPKGDQITLEGYIAMKVVGSAKGKNNHEWQTKWAKLKETLLFLYPYKNDTPGKANVPTIVDLRGARVTSSTLWDKNNKFMFVIKKNSGDEHHFHAMSESERRMWVETITSKTKRTTASSMNKTTAEAISQGFLGINRKMNSFRGEIDTLKSNVDEAKQVADIANEHARASFNGVVGLMTDQHQISENLDDIILVNEY